MAKTVIVKLLGRIITFNAMLNKVTLLWKTRKASQFMNLENDYHLVRFNDEDDYNDILIKGSWVIFGQYLTMRPW